jgi:hypothetical protein
LEKNVWFAFCERILLMRELDRGKRPIEEHDNVRLPENTKRKLGDNSVSTGFGSGPAGRRHFLFTDTARGAYDQAGPSRQEDGQLNDHERAIIGYSKWHIERSGSDAWHELIASIGPNTREFFRDLVSKIPMEEQRVFGIQQPEISRRQQMEQIQNTMIQQQEVHSQAEPDLELRLGPPPAQRGEGNCGE